MAEKVYSIKDIENFTQIKAHTIRVWEQRYSLLKPGRSTNNRRFYSEDQLKKILNINLLYSNGMKISHIAMLCDEEIEEKTLELIYESESNLQSEIDGIVLSVINFKGLRILEYLNKKRQRYSLEYVYENIILGVLSKIGHLWQANTLNIAHEHFFSNLLRDFILSSVYNIEYKEPPKRTALLFLHENEEHELGLMMFHYILKKKGYYCIYLGKNVPVSEIVFINNQFKIDLIATSLVASVNSKLRKHVIGSLELCAEKTPVLLSGPYAPTDLPSTKYGMKNISSIDGLYRYIESIEES
jgi:DNA-binding transcriptional MerR regulator